MIFTVFCAYFSGSFSATPIPSSQADRIGKSYLVNSFLTTVYSGTNASDLAQASNTPWDAIAFGAGSDSSTSIVYGLGADSNSNLNKIYKRTLNAQIVAEGNDSTEACIETVETLLIP